MSGGTLAHEDGDGGGGLCAGRGLALSSQALLRKRRLVRHRLVVVGPQLGHHLDEGQALNLRVEGLWGERAEEGGQLRQVHSGRCSREWAWLT